MQDKTSVHFSLFLGRRRGSPPPSDTARFLLRFLLKMRGGRGECVADLVPAAKGDPSHVRRFEDLLDHHDDILRSSARLEMVNSHYADVVRTLGEDEAPDPEYFLRCYGRMAINSFHVVDEFQEPVGTALYLGPSIMDHSCRYNSSDVINCRHCCNYVINCRHCFNYLINWRHRCSHVIT